MDSISTSARVSSNDVHNDFPELYGGRTEGENARGTYGVLAPDSAPPVSGTGDSGRVLTLPPNRTEELPAPISAVIIGALSPAAPECPDHAASYSWPPRLYQENSG